MNPDFLRAFLRGVQKTALHQPSAAIREIDLFIAEQCPEPAPAPAPEVPEPSPEPTPPAKPANAKPAATDKPANKP